MATLELSEKEKKKITLPENAKWTSEKKLNVINARAAGSSKLPADKKRAPLFFLSSCLVCGFFLSFHAPKEGSTRRPVANLINTLRSKFTTREAN